jgi:hypothetical protein
MKRYLSILPFFIINSLIVAQEVTIQAYAPNLVEVGEQFSLSFTLNAKPTEFNAPSITDFEILAGPSTSSSTSIEVINGKVSRSQSYTYTYILTASKEGKYTIEPAEALVGKERIRSNPIVIEVVKTSSGSSANKTNQAAVRDLKDSHSDELPNDELFVTVELNRRSVYLGEPIEATIKIYTRVSILAFEDAKFPAFDGFWSQEIKESPNVNFERANVNGQNLQCRCYSSLPPFPPINQIKSEIEPFDSLLFIKEEVPARVPCSMSFLLGVVLKATANDWFGKSITINVKKLPQPEPQGIYGCCR